MFVQAYITLCKVSSSHFRLNNFAPAFYYVDFLVTLTLPFSFLVEGYNLFLPFYKEKLEPHVEEDLLNLRVNVYF